MIGHETSGDTEFLAVEQKNPLRLAPALSTAFPRDANYLPATGLREAFDAAMLLGMPLLLTGEPGTGKTRAAFWLRSQLGARLLRQDVKSTSTGRELLYTFDEVARFRDAGKEGVRRALIDYVTFSALGEAIIRAAGPNAAIEPIRRDAKVSDEAFGRDAAGLTAAALLPGDAHFAWAEPEHSVVLVDELDKAPRDTPNDLLAEVETMAFDVPELGVRIAADPARRPILVITSNSERGLPDPFLRRCLYFDIPPPGKADLARIVAMSVDGVAAGTPLFESCWPFYDAVRNLEGIRKRPGTAEFLAWTSCLVNHARFTPGDAISSEQSVVDRVAPTMVCLVKTQDDLAATRRLLEAGTWGATGGIAA
ncbi:MoxR family ATPase [Novosphingobium sp. 9U]|uniref:AAA family ATPase n=1 Tax=Novosphingobium sp. 9U TaxID=2653158 RepID=UPI0012F05280|nr:MoxR family ATPase [Novosphingobium sp. 9U]VWX54608.1 AAA family ATPase [Novosphingobium sp. 9U]